MRKSATVFGAWASKSSRLTSATGEAGVKPSERRMNVPVMTTLCRSCSPPAGASCARAVAAAESAATTAAAIMEFLFFEAQYIVSSPRLVVLGATVGWPLRELTDACASRECWCG